MEYSEQTNGSDRGSDGADYWQSVLLAGGILSVAGVLLNTLFGYMQIGSEPDGRLLNPLMIGSIVVCLATCLGGMGAVWHVVNNVSPYMTLGRGALIGFLTGAAIVIFSALLNELWQMVDPTFSERVLDSVISNIERMDMPADTRQQMIDQMAADAGNPSLIQQIVAGIPFTGLLNLLSGMLGVRLFADRQSETGADDLDA